MKAMLYAAAISLPLFAAPAFAGSEGYESGPASAISAASPFVETGSDGYQSLGRQNATVGANVAIRDSGSEAMPLFQGQAGSSGDAKAVAAYWRANRS
jgi:hypothetical protein